MCVETCAAISSSVVNSSIKVETGGAGVSARAVELFDGADRRRLFRQAWQWYCVVRFDGLRTW
jgi:hypothetical protein